MASSVSTRGTAFSASSIRAARRSRGSMPSSSRSDRDGAPLAVGRGRCGATRRTVSASGGGEEGTDAAFPVVAGTTGKGGSVSPPGGPERTARSGGGPDVVMGAMVRGLFIKGSDAVSLPSRPGPRSRSRAATGAASGRRIDGLTGVCSSRIGPRSLRVRAETCSGSGRTGSTNTCRRSAASTPGTRPTAAAGRP